jgi:acyl-CoA synthetase (AMP-forming)/AMP-acid ligase II
VPAVLPLYHLYGMAFLTLGRLAHGCKIVTLPNFEPKSFFKLLDQHQVLLVLSNISTECFSQQFKFFCHFNHSGEIINGYVLRVHTASVELMKLCAFGNVFMHVI